MNCERAQQAFVAALAGERDTREDAVLAQHLSACRECAAATSDVAALWSNLGELPEVLPPADLRRRFDAALADWRQGEVIARRHATHRSGWRDRIQAAVGGWRPATIASACALGVLGFGLGHFAALRGEQMNALRRDLQSTRAMVALSLLQQRSPVDRLQGVGWSTRVTTPAPEVVDVLFETLNGDDNVDVRLAAADALARLQDVDGIGVRFVRALENQTSPLVQIAIIDALAARRDTMAQPALRSLAADSLVNEIVRARARWADRQLTM